MHVIWSLVYLVIVIAHWRSEIIQRLSAINRNRDLNTPYALTIELCHTLIPASPHPLQAMPHPELEFLNNVCGLGTE
jgi:hypothetical protein